MLSLRDLAVPVLGAPMAGGPTTPALAAAVTEAGGLGFLAAGYLAAQRFAEDIAATRARSSGPVVVNLFVPQACSATGEELDSYRRALAPAAERFGVEPGRPYPDDDDWAAKLDVVVDARPQVASFTFGCPDAAVLSRLRDVGVLTMVTVTSRGEAEQAVADGAGALVAQGPEAGGHRSVFAPNLRPPHEPLDDLLTATVDLGVPVVAAGGIGDAAAVAAGDPQHTSLWAGTSWRGITGGPAGDIVAALAGDAR